MQTDHFRARIHLKDIRRENRLFPDHQRLHDRIINADTLLETASLP